MRSDSDARDSSFNPDTRSLGYQVEAYVKEAGFRGLSPQTIKSIRDRLRLFVRWCEENRISLLTQADQKVIEAYDSHLLVKRLQPKTRLGYLKQIRHFFGWLHQKKLLWTNPAGGLVLPRVPYAVKTVLSLAEIERVMEIPDTDTPFGLRNRAILETFWATGIRAKELLGLTVFDIEISDRRIRIKEGKGNKQRLVPVHETALDWIFGYRKEIRPWWLKPDKKTDVLFITSKGKPLDYPTLLSRVVKPALRKAGIKKPGAAHLFRHSLATHMLKKGASLEEVRLMLGHSRMETTKIYTHLDIRYLRETIIRYHPGEQKNG